MNITLPSLRVIWESTFKTFQRFPLVIGSAIVGAIAFVWLINQNESNELLESQFFAQGFVGFLGISWFYSNTVFLDQLKNKKVTSWPFLIAALIALVGYYLYLDTILINAQYEVWYQLALFFLATHLFAAFSPFVSSGNIDQFWEYNKTLFLRFLISGVYSATLFIGLSIALLALDNLLEINVEDEFYPSLFVVIGGVFNTWFFLAGIPSKDEIPNKEIQYPTGLKVFVQYVLIPLVTVYIVILYAYLVKIIVQWDLPTGWVANLVLSFSIAGILSLLLLYPIQNDEGKKWIQLFSKWYYRALIPLVILLFVSIWVRISEYGVTINRYFVATLGVWLTLTVIYFVFSKVKSIKAIPISLIVFVLFSALGPFSAFNVSERSQLSRILELTQSVDILRSKTEIQSIDFSNEDIIQINSVVSYLVENHGVESFHSILENERSDLIADSINYKSSYGKVEFILEEVIGIPWRNLYNLLNDDGSQSFSYNSYSSSPLNISEYEFDLGSIYLNEKDSYKIVEIDDAVFEIVVDFNKAEIEIRNQLQVSNIALSEFISNLHENNDNNWYKSEFESTDLIITDHGGGLKVLLEVKAITGIVRNESKLSSINTRILVGEK